MRDQYMRTGQGFILFYTIISRSSFNEVKQFREQILRVQDKDQVPMILCATMCDLADRREVSTEEGQNLASLWGIPFFETSSKQRINIDEAFHQIVREIRNSFIQSRPPPRKLHGGCSLI
uniref:Ras family protein n=1 Tax=Arcella intermedia TaxID=1963864 RepID=A0A6B2LRJ8_9EUKA